MEVKKETQRNSGIELLRVISMFMIVCYHLFSFHMQNYFSDNHSLYIVKLIMTSLIFNGYVGVVCFIFISSYYGIKFKIKQVVSLVIQALFYSYTCLFFFSLFSDIWISTDYLIKYFFPISSSLWWFFTAYILLYFLSPFLNSGIKALTKKQYQMLLVGFFYFNCIANFAFDLQFGGHLINFIFIYLLGRYINIYNFKLKHPLVFFFIGNICIFFVNFFVGEYLDKPVLFASRYTSILVIFSSVCLFFVFKDIKVKNKFVYTIAPLCFGVYLLHFNYFTWNGVISSGLFKIVSLYESNHLKFILANIGFTLVVFVVCLFAEKIRQVICNPLLRLIDRKIDKFKMNI